LIELPADAGPLLNRFSFPAARLPQRGYKPRKDSLQWRRGADSPPMSQRERVAHLPVCCGATCAVAKRQTQIEDDLRHAQFD
jgi:hypothetical protein